jgi:probable HAF family extracellular repeat protein
MVHDFSDAWSKMARRKSSLSRRRQRAARPRFVPGLERLEDRTVPSGGYTFSTIDDPNGFGNPSGTFEFASGINSAGNIVGYYYDRSFFAHGFLLSGGQYTTLDDPGVRDTNPFGINSLGQIVGSYNDNFFNLHGFLLSGGQYTPVDDPNGVSTEALGINTAGQIVGLSVDSGNADHAFLLNGGQYTTIDDPNEAPGEFLGSIANGINDSGQIVGAYNDSSTTYHGFLLSSGQYTAVEDPNAVGVPGLFLGTLPRGIDGHGDIVGSYSDANGVWHGFLLSGGQYTTLDDPDVGQTFNFEVQGTFLTGINDSGQIVGYYGDTTGYHAFLATPLQVATTTMVTASPNPSIFGQAVTFTATVQPTGSGSGTPSGSVDFVDTTTNTDLGLASLSGGSASVTTSDLGVGSHVIQVSYSGDSNFAPSTGSLTQNVDYNFIGFLPPLNQNLSFGAGRTVPIKFQLTDFNGNFISDLTDVTGLQVIYPDSSANAVSGLRYDSTDNQFIANWSTKGLSDGSYTISLSLLDGTTHTVTIQITAGNSSAGMTTVAAGGTTAAPGGLLGGDITLYVDNSNGDLTADELARIQDAVMAVDAVTEAYGVAVTEVTDPKLADVTLNMDTTSAVGGYADGVLACTTDAEQITIINGWNFYAGSDATHIGSGRYDFETVVTHELGHALGLGHSTDCTSVMYATLNTGAVNRSLKTADLNVADSDTTGACALHAAAMVGRVSNPSYEEAGRDLFFALAGTADLPLGSWQLSGWTGEPSRIRSDVPVDAVFALMSERPIFAGQSQRETDDPLFGVSIVPDPAGSDAADRIVDLIPAESVG